MRIVVVSAFYSEGMGYTENCLPKALAALGNEVHLITSNLNVYGTSPDYEATYASFLGAADQGEGIFECDGYTVHRLTSAIVRGYVHIRRLAQVIRAIRPDVVHCTEIASLPAFVVAAAKPTGRFKFFAESHQHLSVVKPFLKQETGALLRKAVYRLTRTLPTYLASLAVEKCYAIAPDCLYVARHLYGVPERKAKLQPLGTDTELFRPAMQAVELTARAATRRELGYGDGDVVCIYTGRLSADKNPLLLARAVDSLADGNPKYHALFIGEGLQKDEILRCRNAQVLPFVRHRELADYYRMADLAVWPRQESMSMLDAAACGLPLVAADSIGESERIAGNGRVYRENSVEDLMRVLASLSSSVDRRTLGTLGRQKMERGYSWSNIARSIVSDYVAASAAS
ncbi:MAG: glycosyltransferase family 4 protein [Gammaproteobacteria bacterium]|nr:glycosyltransferase family 4 protein [Gammaproteobacteria bacterium]